MLFSSGCVKNKDKTAKTQIIADLIILKVFGLLIGLLKTDILAYILVLLMPFYLWFSNRKKELLHLGIAFITATTWMLFAKDMYGYNQKFLILFGVNMYPLALWTLALFLSYAIINNIQKLLKSQSTWKNFLIYMAFYWVLLITAEILAYHVFNVKNSFTSQYAGLPICDCIHAPPWMQIVYLCMGPAYYIIIRYVEKLSKNI